MIFPDAIEVPGHPGLAMHYGNPLTEQRAWEAGRGIGDLTGMVGLIGVTGEDRLSWLNSLSSQKLDALVPHTSTQTLFLDARGHIENMAGVVDDGETTWLVTEYAKTAELAAWLVTMRFRARVDVIDRTREFALFAVPQGEDGLPDGCVSSAAVVWHDPWPAVLEGGTRYGPAEAEHPRDSFSTVVFAVPAGDAAALVNAGLKPVGAMAFDALRIAAWQPSSAEYADGRTLPHELDWLRTAVHLHKGCYRGQETVARTHNVGHPPRRLVMLHLDGSTSELPEPGAALTAMEPVSFDHDVQAATALGGESVGFITSAALHYELGPIALALVTRSLDPGLILRAGDVSAAQELIVPVSGESIDRPHLTRPAGVARPLQGSRRGLM